MDGTDIRLAILASSDRESSGGGSTADRVACDSLEAKVAVTTEPEKVILAAKAHSIGAQEIGEISDESDIRIKNRDIEQKEEWLTF